MKTDERANGSFLAHNRMATQDVPHSAGSFLQMLNARRVEQRLTMLEMDGRIELAENYASKLFCKMKSLGPKSFGRVLAALDVRIVLVPGDTPLERK